MLKSMAVRLLSIKPINQVLVALLTRLPDSSWKHRIPVIGTASVRLGSTQVLLGHAERDQVAREVFWSDGRLRKQNDQTALNLAVKLSEPSDLFLDIGAFSGIFSLCVARANPSVKCFAYELVPDNFLLLWQNVIRNNLVGHVTPCLMGIGSDAGTVRSPTLWGGQTLPTSVALDWSVGEGTDVPVRALDGLFPEFSGSAVFKIDVEGFEWEVMKGGAGLIERTRPDMICEVLRRAPNIGDMQDFLHSLGYRLYHITDHGLRLADRIMPDRDARDWLFTLKSSDELTGLGFPVISGPAANDGWVRA